MKEHNSFSYLRKCDPDVPNTFGEIRFWKIPTFTKEYELKNVLPPSNFAVWLLLFSMLLIAKSWNLRKLHKSTSSFWIFEPRVNIYTATSSMEIITMKPPVALDWQNNNFARASRYFVHWPSLFLCRRCTTMYNVKGLISRFVEDVNEDKDFLFHFLNFLWPRNRIGSGAKWQKKKK